MTHCYVVRLYQDFHELKLHQFQADIIVSMMAGISIDTIQAKFPNSNIFRIIPNTPCEFGLGITPIYTKSANLYDLEVSTLYAALSRCGVVLPVPQEKMIDWATGISARRPAYIMYIAKAMIDAGCEMGFELSEVGSLVAHTLARSSKLLLNTNKSPEMLAREVMTPKGTTEQGIHLLEANNVNSIVKNALLAASKRADELSKSKEKEVSHSSLQYQKHKSDSITRYKKYYIGSGETIDFLEDRNVFYQSVVGIFFWKRYLIENYQTTVIKTKNTRSGLLPSLPC